MQSNYAIASIGTLKTSGYIAMVAVFEYLQISQEQLGLLAVLMVADLLTGIAKQYRINPQEITSHAAWI